MASHRIALIGLGLLAASVGMGCDDTNIDPTPPVTSTSTDATNANPARRSAAISAEPSTVPAGGNFDLKVLPLGDARITWGQSAALIRKGGSPADGFILIGGPRGSGVEPRAYRADDSFAVADIGYAGGGSLFLILPREMASGVYELTFRVSVRDLSGELRRTEDVTTELTIQ